MMGTFLRLKILPLCILLTLVLGTVANAVAVYTYLSAFQQVKPATSGGEKLAVQNGNARVQRTFHALRTPLLSPTSAAGQIPPPMVRG
jgi:hypothetical protein